ncbi:hypothetical protein ZWY2020_059169 [Hordeum vulgare]|nr:hypothetical protein ZWY2020_059169 [Hordeum vulgare]
MIAGSSPPARFFADELRQSHGHLKKSPIISLPSSCANAAVPSNSCSQPLLPALEPFKAAAARARLLAPCAALQRAIEEDEP